MNRSKRPRVLFAILAAFVVPLGLATRLGSRDFLPHVVATYGGDTLWALFVYLLIATVFSRWAIWQIAAVTYCFSCAIEISQLYHAAWLDSIRQTLIGSLVLGQGFLWSDLACYAVGTAMGVLIDLGACRVARARSGITAR